MTAAAGAAPAARRLRSGRCLLSKKLSANKGINYKSTPDWEKAAMEFTAGRGVDQVVEVGGAGTLTRSFGAIRVGGKIRAFSGFTESGGDSQARGFVNPRC